MTSDRLARFRELLQTEDRDHLKAECASLFADGIEHREILQVILSRASQGSVADPSWLPAASTINLSDSLVHVRLQSIENRHKMVAFGQLNPEFRRIERPPLIQGSLAEVHARFQDASIGNDWQLAERCLLTICDQSGIESVFETVLNCLMESRYLGVTSGPWWSGIRHLAIGCQIELWQEFGENAMQEIACYLGAKQCTKMVNPPGEDRARAMAILEEQFELLDSPMGKSTAFDESRFKTQVGSGDVSVAFRAIGDAWNAGVASEQIDLALTMLCVERILRGGTGRREGEAANWDNLKRELQATGVIRRAKVISEQLAYKASMHAAWQIVRHGDEGLAAEIPEIQKLSEGGTCDEDGQIDQVIQAIESAHSSEAIHQASNFMNGGHNPEHLLREMILWVNMNCKGGGYYAGQRGMIDAWYLAESHPERNRIPLALAGWMADYRKQHFKHEK